MSRVGRRPGRRPTSSRVQSKEENSLIEAILCLNEIRSLIAKEKYEESMFPIIEAPECEEEEHTEEQKEEQKEEECEDEEQEESVFRTRGVPEWGEQDD
jgi:hypothetical protein